MSPSAVAITNSSPATVSCIVRSSNSVSTLIKIHISVEDPTESSIVPAADSDRTVNEAQPATGGRNSQEPSHTNNYRFPGEVLMIIFAILVVPSGHIEDSRRGEASALIAASQTSSLWRRVAIGTPELWGQILQINEDTSRRFSIILSRSLKNSEGISIVSSIPNFKSGEFSRRTKHIFRNWEALLFRLYRCKRFFVRLGNAPLWNPISFTTALCDPNPILQSFTVLQNATPAFGYEPLTPGRPPFHGYAPALTTLQVQGPYALLFVTRNVVYELLTTLVLHHMGRLVTHQETHDLTPTVWARRLQNLPSLTTLILYNAVFPVLDDNEESEDDATGCTLPRLEFMKIVGYTEPCIFLVRRIDVPPTCRICVITTPGTPRIHNVSFGGIIEIYTRLLTDANLRGSSLTLGTMTGFQVAVEEKGRCIFQLEVHYPVGGTFASVFEHTEVVAQFLEAVIPVLDSHHRDFLRSLTTVVLRIDKEAEFESSRPLLLLALFQHFLSVEVIHFHGLCANTIPILWTHFQNPSPRLANPVIQYSLPRLKTLVVAVPGWEHSDSLMRYANDPYWELAKALKLRLSNHEVTVIGELVMVNGDGYSWDVDNVSAWPEMLISEGSPLRDEEVNGQLVLKDVKDIYPLRREKLVWKEHSQLGMDLVIDNIDESEFRL